MEHKTSENCEETNEYDEIGRIVQGLGLYSGEVRLIMDPNLGHIDDDEAAAEEIMMLWGMQQPTFSKPNAFVSQSSLQLPLDACGHSLSILQSPSSLCRALQV